MRRFLPLLFFFCVAAVLSATALADSPANACAKQNPAFTTDDLSGIPAPCVAAPGSMILEALYYQNASRVGGTALAAYPLFRFRTGIVRHVEVVLDTPSQVAESGANGTGLYPTTRMGYGLNYTFTSDPRMAASFGAEVQPPSSRFVVNQTQPRYVLDFTASDQVSSRATFSANATGASSSDAGFERIFPAAAVRLAYDSSAVTQFSTDVGMRFVARHAVAQSYFDVAVNERLHSHVNFLLGIGTTLNPVSNAKAHYLASGFTFRLR